MKSILRKIATVISFIGLLFILVPTLRYFLQPASSENYLLYVQIGTVLWFISSPLWLIQKRKDA